MNDSNNQIPAVASHALFCVGDSVTWTHATSTGKSFGFSTRQGKIEVIGKVTARVKLRNYRREWVLLARLRKEGQRTELTEMIQEMASDARKEGSAKTDAERHELETGFERRISSQNKLL